jgi:signal transduction histidine kinase
MAAIKTGKQVTGEWDMLGQRYISAFDAIKDNKGNIIGSIDVSVPKSAILSAQRKNQKTIALITLAGLAMALTFAVLVAYRITMPLRRIKQQADAFANGDMQARVDIEWDKDTRNDIGILAMTFNAMVETVRKKGEEKERYLTELAEKNIELNGLNEKLRGANEELEVSFEELQSQSEEVQSASEELRVLNEDMDRKNAELMEANRIIRMEEEYLREAKDKLRLIYDTIRDYILLIDKDLTVLEANRCFMEGMKLSESYVIGRTLCHCFGIKDSLQECPAKAAPGSEADYAVAGIKADAQGYCPVKRSIGSKTPVEMEMTVEGRIFQWHSFPLNAEDGGADMAVVYIKDISEERLLMQRLIQSDKLASVGELVSGVAHELNNPLTSVMGFSELLLRDNIDEDVKKKANYIHESSLRCKHIIDNLLTFSRWRKPDRVYQDVNSMLKGVVELKSYHIRVSNINVELDLDPSLPWTMADGYQLQQVFLNLLNNAQHAIEEKGREGKIIISSRCKDNKIVISFSDTGGGIPKNIVGRIFDPFFTTKEVGKGTGLGLSISYGIIREHGGDIRVESSPDVGTTFVIDLPVITATDKGQAMKPAATVHDTAVLKGLRALILDDEPVILDLLNEVLAGDGFHVETTSEGHKAIGMIKENDYNVIISDLKMPGMGGKQFYEAVKSIRPEAARRIIFISGDTASKETQEFLARCGNPFLQKPFDIEKLKEVILKIIS